MSQELIKHDPELIKRARELAGINTKVSKTSYVKIAYNEENIPKGNFLLKLWNKETEAYTTINLGPTFEAVILTTTKKCGQWDNLTGTSVYESNEYDKHSDILTLSSDGEEVAKGTYRQLKDTKYPNLKYQNILYLFFPNKGYCAKMFIKGESVFSYTSYENFIVNDMGSTLQAFTTVFSTKKMRQRKPVTEDDKQGGVIYYDLQFKQGEYVDLNVMIEKSAEVRKGIELMRNKQPKVKVEQIDEATAPGGTVTEVIPVPTEAEGIEDLPF